MELLAFILVFFPVVVIHEFGHMIAAKYNGVPVAAFCVGFGKTLFAFTHKGTVYAWKLIPLGGYVVFYTKDFENQYYAHSKWARFQISIMGPIANFALTFAALWIVSLMTGINIAQAFLAAGYAFSELLMLLLSALGDLFTGQLSLISDMSGPVGIADAAEKHSRDPLEFIMFLGFLSLNVAVLNLLPIPGLDGGDLFVIATEAVAGRDFSIATKMRIRLAGFLFLITIILIVLGGDIYELFIPRE